MVAQSAALLEALERSALRNSSQLSLSAQAERSVTTTCAEIEAVLGSELPPSAQKYATWWGIVVQETGQQASTEAWLLPGKRETVKAAASASTPIDTRADYPPAKRGADRNGGVDDCS
jgi:hypothetical protein